MAKAAVDHSRDVFVNCPFDSQYHELFRALIFVIIVCGFLPRVAKEADDGSELRLDKLYRLIRDCPYGVHDLSRTELDKKTNLPRFNMPLELGIYLGAKRYGHGAQRRKHVLILDRSAHRYEKFISDLAGVDIHVHGGKANQAIQETRNWLSTQTRSVLPGGADIIENYKRFRRQVPRLSTALKWDPNKLTYADFVYLATKWARRKIKKR